MASDSAANILARNAKLSEPDPVVLHKEEHNDFKRE